MSILCATYDPSRTHGEVIWRVYGGLPVVEIVNNWECATFAETYRPPLIGERIADVLQAIQPEIVHVHNLLNLSFDLPALARARGIPVVATLHDYTLVCPSGGQRIHQSEQYVCHDIDPDRCVRCFRESPFFSQASFGTLARYRAPRSLQRAAAGLVRRLPGLAGHVADAARHTRLLPLTRGDVDARLAAAAKVFDAIDVFVAPSPSVAAEFQRLGVSAVKIRVSDYGFVPIPRRSRSGELRTSQAGRALRLGFVGTLVWHKGAHVLIEAVRMLSPASFELKIFGSPDVFPVYSAALRTRAAGLPISFLGGFDRTRTAEVFAQFDVLVVPSLWLENSPLVIHEAFMAGMPVVGARMGGIPDLVEDEVTGLLYDSTSPRDLAAALQRLIDSPALVETMAARAGIAQGVKSIAADASEWDAVYTDALRRRTRSTATA